MSTEDAIIEAKTWEAQMLTPEERAQMDEENADEQKLHAFSVAMAQAEALRRIENEPDDIDLTVRITAPLRRELGHAAHHLGRTPEGLLESAIKVILLTMRVQSDGNNSYMVLRSADGVIAIPMMHANMLGKTL